MFRFLVAFLVMILGLARASVASADPGREGQTYATLDPIIAALITDDDLFSLADLSPLLSSPLSVGGSNGTQHYGPFASGSPDSGTCGNDWAQDTFDRHFTVRPTAAGFTIVEQFKQGTFVTNGGFSPGACQLDDGSSTTLVTAGLQGTMHGYLVVTVDGTQISTDPSCIAEMPTARCTTGGFVESHFTGVSTTDTFFFHCAGNDGSNADVVEHEWKNASDDRGGNHGDIATE